MFFLYISNNCIAIDVTGGTFLTHYNKQYIGYNILYNIFFYF